MLASRASIRNGAALASKRNRLRGRINYEGSISSLIIDQPNDKEKREDHRRYSSLVKSGDHSAVVVQSYWNTLNQTLEGTPRVMESMNLNSPVMMPQIRSIRGFHSSPSPQQVPGTNNQISQLGLEILHKSPSYSNLPYSTKVVKHIMYGTTLRALASAGIDPDSHLSRSFHRIVHRAYFSTDTTPSNSQTPLPPVKGSSPQKPQSVPVAIIEGNDGKKSIQKQIQEAITSATKMIISFMTKLPGWTWFYLTHPTEARESLKSLWEAIKHEAHHYWVGSKLLYADVQTAMKLVRRTLKGSSLTRRERKQLLRTVSDLFRLVPFSMFILIPFMEFALPFALRLFPNMLPSTFQDSLKAEESMKRELQSRIAMAKFFQETLQEMAKEQKKNAQRRIEKFEESGGETTEEEGIAQKQEESAASMLEFLEKARNGEMLPPDVIIQFSHHFKDDLTLDNMPRMQLINMCKYMNIPPYGADTFLRFQLRHHIRTLIEDDQRILWEGIDSLNKMELREACRERGMRSTGLTTDGYKRALQQWLDLSVNKNIPISLLVMSRTFFLRDEVDFTGAANEETSVAGLADAISGMDQDIVNEVVLEVATSEERKSNPDVTKIKLEVLEAQNERILEEQKEWEAAQKKEAKDKEKEKAEFEEMEAEEKTITPADEILQLPDEQKRPIPTIPEVVTTDEVTSTKTAHDDDDDDEEHNLTSHEMDAISQLINPDPVNKERESLEQIKAAMKSEDEVEDTEEEVENIVQIAAETEEPAPVKDEILEPLASADAVDETARQVIEKADEKVAVEADEMTKIEISSADSDDVAESSSSDNSLDKAIANLKARVEKMVDTIETQMTSVEGKIGDKLHFLDKDMDGVLTQEEMAHALQTVLKRDISFEEAMEIAEDMDENEDGFFTVEELIGWIETHKTEQLIKEGRTAELENAFENKGEKSSDESTQKQTPES